jgi:hypothetical protein
VDGAAFDGAGGGDQRLADDLAAEDALPADLRAQASENIAFQLLKVENLEERFDRIGHGQPRRYGAPR